MGCVFQDTLGDFLSCSTLAFSVMWKICLFSTHSITIQSRHTVEPTLIKLTEVIVATLSLGDKLFHFFKV